jgi:hypothetical protein
MREPIAVTVEIDPNKLGSYTDELLAAYWHVAQANPVPYDDPVAGELVELVGREIIRRWLRDTHPKLWSHKGSSYYHTQLTRFAKYAPPAGAAAGSLEWQRGEWTLKPEAIAAATDTDSEGE